MPGEYFIGVNLSLLTRLSQPYHVSIDSAADVLLCFEIAVELEYCTNRRGLLFVEIDMHS